MLAKKWINPEQLLEALEAQRHYGGKLGYWLVKYGSIDEQKLIAALSEQMRVPWVEDIRKPFSEEAVGALPKMLCKRLNIFPLEPAKDNRLTIAVDYGVTGEMIEVLNEVMGRKVRPFVTRAGVLQQLIEEHVDSQADNTADLIPERCNLASHVGQNFVKKWVEFEAERARFGLVEETLWVRYLKGEQVKDHFMLFNQTSGSDGPQEEDLEV